MVATQVFKKQLQVCLPTVQVVRCNECKDAHIAVEPIVEVPVQAPDLDLVYELTNGVYIPKGGKPGPPINILSNS